MKSFLPNLILLLVSLGLSLTAAEYGLRYYRTSIKPEPTSGMVIAMYKRLPHDQGMRYAVDEDMNFQYKSHVAYNNWGYRFPRDYSAEKQPGEFRIAVLGDSYTENVPNDFSWVEKFAEEIEHNQALKNKLGAKKITVANFGNSGSGVIHMARQLHLVKKIFKPDLAIFAFIDEDFNRVGDWGTFEPAESVEDAIAEITVPQENLIPVKGAPGFELERVGGSISRMVYYNGDNQDIVADKRTLKRVHHAMIFERVHNGKILLWEEAKKWWSHYAPAPVAVVDPQAQEKQSRDGYFSYFEQALDSARANAPSVLFINLPTYYETIDQWDKKKAPKPFVYWPDFFKRRPDVPLISLSEYLPMQAPYEERESWFVLPWDGHPSNIGAALYGKTAAKAVSQYLAGNKKAVTVNRALLAKEQARYQEYLKQQK